MELKHLKENQNEHLNEGSDQDHKRIDALNSRLLRKEAMERQLCNELQVMLDERTREGYEGGKIRQAQEEDKKQRPDKNHKDDGFIRRRLQPEGTTSVGSEDTDDSEDIEDNEAHSSDAKEHV